ncbi:MAG: hypothetical protein LBV46_01155 [Bacteroidales bacterium]|jgi:hypothetical protein|nr:hypothetical protein [Bacteroidales bacterium]
MKLKIWTLIIFVCFTFHCYGQTSLPEKFRPRLDALQEVVRNNLREYRYISKIELPHNLQYSNLFSDQEIIYIDSMNIDVNIGLIYDDAMRNRILDIMNNRYEDYELDTLIARQIQSNQKGYEYQAMQICGFDTLSLFKTTLDSFYLALTQRHGDKNVYKYDILKLLKLDTTIQFQQAYQNVIRKELEFVRNSILTDTYENYNLLANLCGYIGDKRFAETLIVGLDKPNNFREEVVLEALARIQVEPYYSDYVKFRTRTMAQIKNEEPGFDIADFVYVLGTQEAYLELSKYLLSDYPYNFTVVDYFDTEESFQIPNPMSKQAFYFIEDYILNEDLQSLRKNLPHTDDFTPIYNWMQANYGKYKIRKIW